VKIELSFWRLKNSLVDLCKKINKNKQQHDHYNINYLRNISFFLISQDSEEVQSVEVDSEAAAVVDIAAEVAKLPSSKNTSTSMFHHQSKKNSVNNVQSQSLKPKSTTRSSSLRLHLLHLTRLQSSQSNHKTKKRHSSTFW
jgi:hypothetical protein